MSTRTFSNDIILLEAFASGDRRAFEQLIRDWYARLVIFSESYYGVRTEAEEIVDDAFLKAWEARTKFDALPKLKSFLYTVVRNAALDAARRAKTRAAHLPPPDMPAEPELPGTLDAIEMMRAEVIAALYAAIEQLPDRAREVVLLTYREGLSSAQIAERLGVNESTVRSHRARAIELLRVALADRYPLLPLSVTVLLTELFANG